MYNLTQAHICSGGLTYYTFSTLSLAEMKNSVCEVETPHVVLSELTQNSV